MRQMSKREARPRAGRRDEPFRGSYGDPLSVIFNY
jgi:hypothetical protein